jgi:hypothetical protein
MTEADVIAEKLCFFSYSEFVKVDKVYKPNDAESCIPSSEAFRIDLLLLLLFIISKEFCKYVSGVPVLI